MSTTILIVEDDEGIRTSLEKSFSRRDYEVVTAGLVAAGCRVLTERKIHVILVDLRLPDGSGLDVLTAARDLDPDIDVVVITAFPEVSTAVRAMREGARDYIVKPFDLEDLHLSVRRVIETRELHRTVRRLRRERPDPGTTAGILGESAAIAEVREHIGMVAQADTPVLVVGASFT